MPTALRQQAYSFGSLRKDPHWSVQGLVFYSQFKPAKMLFDEARGNHGTITGPTWVGNALSFNGTSDYVAVPHIFAFNVGTTGSVTIIARFIKHDDDDSRVVWKATSAGSSAVDYGLQLSFGRIYFYIGTGTYISVLIDEDVWYTVAGVWDGTNRYLYIDGKSAISPGSAGSTKNAANANPLHIGGLPGGQFLGGNISDIKIYNRVLSASEIAALYINPDLPMQQPPIWLFKAPVVGAVPKGPLGHPLYGPFAGPIAC